MNNLRDRLTLRTDGGLRTGRDIVMAAMMGGRGIRHRHRRADRHGLHHECASASPTHAPWASARRTKACARNSPARRTRSSTSSPSTRRRCGRLSRPSGRGSLDDVIGRADLLTQVSRGAAHLDDLDLNPMLITVDGADRIVYDRYKAAQRRARHAGRQIVKDAHRFLEDGEKMQLSYAVQNTYRTIGTRTSSHIVQAFGMRNQLQPDHLTVAAGRLGGPEPRRLRRAGPEADRIGGTQTTMSARACRAGSSW